MEALAIIGVVVMSVGCIACIGIPALLLRAWAFVTLWSWFVVPAFNVRPMGYALAMGLMLFVGLLHQSRDYKDHEIDLNKHLINAASHPLIAVGIGWLIKYFGGL